MTKMLQKGTNAKMVFWNCAQTLFPYETAPRAHNQKLHPDNSSAPAVRLPNKVCIH